MCVILMGWKDSVWEQRIKERVQNEQDVNTALDWGETIIDIGLAGANALKLNNPLDMSGKFNKYYSNFKNTLFY